MEVENRGNEKDPKNGALNDESLGRGTLQSEQNVVHGDHYQCGWIEHTISVQPNIGNR